MLEFQNSFLSSKVYFCANFHKTFRREAAYFYPRNMISATTMEFSLQRYPFSLGVPTSMNLFEKLIQPVVLYGSEIWGALSHHQLSSIFKDPNLLCKYLLDSTTEKPKLKFSKLILGLKRNTSTLAVYGI